MTCYQDVAYSLYCDRVRNRTPYCKIGEGFSCGGRYETLRSVKNFLYPDRYCPTVIAAVDRLEAAYPLMKVSYEVGDAL